MRSIPINPFYHFTNRSNTLPHMSIRNVASVDNSVGSRAVYVAPDNRGEITRCDNRRHSKSQIDPTAEYPGPIEASVLLLFSSGLNANLFEQIMRRMRGEDVNDILAKSLGAEGVLPGRQIESLLRVCNQFAPTLPSG